MFRSLLYIALLTSSLSIHRTGNSACPGTVTASFNASQTHVCGVSPTAISFTNTSTGANAGSSTYEWFLNGTSFDNTNGLAAPINSTISASGTYTYMLVATDNSVPCSDTAIVVVAMSPAPNAQFTFGPNNACAGTQVNFNNNSTGNGGFSSWNWNFGDGNNSTANNPNHTYVAGGTYNVTLTQTNGTGCTSTFSQTVTAQDIPNVSISGDDGDGDLVYCLLPGDPTTSETVTFFNNTTGGVSYEWDYGDGSPIFTTNSTASHTHSYTTFGTFTVTMTAYHANGCTSTATLTVVFEKYVSAALTLDITEYSGCTPHSLSTLQNLSVNANNYVWDFGDGTVITTPNFAPPNHAYATQGNYTITLTASNSCNSATATISPIVIIEGPTAQFAQSVTYGCAPQNVNFTNQSQDAVPNNNYFWDMGNGNTYTNTITPPAQTYPTVGDYQVMLVAGNSCGTDTAYSTIYIDTVPIVDLTALPAEGCSPLSVTSTTNSSGGNLTWAWYIDGIYSYNIPDTIPDQIFMAPPGNNIATHNIQVTVSNQCGNDSDIETITVHPEVQAIFTANDTVCEGQSITFTEASLGDTLSWDWDFGNGNTANTPGPHTITYVAVGTYTVTLTVTGHCGVDVLTMDVEVLPNPVVQFNALPNPLCEGDTLDITNSSSIGGLYSWSFGPNASPATGSTYNPGSIVFSDSGTQEIIHTVDLLGCVVSDTEYVYVEPLPLPSFTISPNDGCTPLVSSFTNNGAGGPNTFSWDLGNGGTSNSHTPTDETYTTVLNDTTYTIWLVETTPAGCVDSISQTITVHPLPVADFTPLPDTVCAQTAVGFLNNSTGASSFNWDFDDGNTSTAISPSHAFATAGTYNVELIASTVFNCTDTIYQSVVVDSIPTADFNFSIECVGTTTIFTDLSTGGIQSWSWDFGDGNTSTLQNPQHLYAAAGTYNVSLTVTNLADCPVSVSQLVTVNDVPVANFTNSPSCLGQQMTFTDLTTGVPISWGWDFGDGNTSSAQNPTHQYGAVGTYTVELIVGGGSGCFDTISQIVEVDSVPTSDFTFVEVCATENTQFTSQALGSPDLFIWDFGDGNSNNTNDPSPSHAYATGGTYNVSLVVGYSASGCTDTLTLPVEAYPRTVPDFTTNTPCLGAATLFTDATSNSPTSWAWDFGDGSAISINQNPTHTYSAAGTYTVQLITDNVFGCVDSVEIPVTVYPLPTAGFSYDTVCLGAVTTLQDQSTNSVAWNWDFGDGNTDLNASPSYVYSDSGTYSVVQVVTNSFGCTDTAVNGITVYPNPSAGFEVDTACFSYATSFADTSISAVAWSWDFGDGSPLDNTQNTSHIYPQDGNYTAQLLVTNVFGCSDSIQRPITVLPQPEAGFENFTVCAGESVVFADTSLGSPNTWSWDFGDGSPLDNNQNLSHTYSTGGVYNVQLIAGNTAGCYDTTVVPVDVYTVPTPLFSADTVCYLNITNFQDLSTDAVAITDWYWDFGDTINQSTLQNPTYIYQNPGTYQVSLTVTNSNGCDSSIVLPVVVNEIPVADFVFDTVCVGTPTTFVDSSSEAPNSWLWDFGDGNASSTGPTVQHTYGSAGNYLVSLIVDGGQGCTDQVFKIVTVSDVVTADISAPDSVCDGTTVNFTDASTITSGSISGWTWDFGDGSPIDTTQNPPHTYSDTGTYTVVLTVLSSGGCTSITSHEIDINANPEAGFIGTIPCEGQATQFTNTSSAHGGVITQWNWDFGDGSTSGVQNPAHTYGSFGIYNVTLVIDDTNGCSSSITNPVEIYPQPNAAFTNTTECGGDTIHFTDQSSVGAGSITQWDWSFGSTAQNPDHVFSSASDTFTVQLIITTDLGCVDSVSQVVQTHPVVVFNYGPNITAGCPALMVTFYDSSTTTGGGGILNWLWDFGDGYNGFSQNPTHVYVDSGNYYAALSVTTLEGCTYYDTLTYPIVVYPQPYAEFTYDSDSASVFEPDFQFYDESLGAINYEWYFGDGFGFSNDQDPAYTYQDTGTFDVTLIAYNNYGCSDTVVHPVTVYAEYAFYVPNAFSPNGDGRNDYFVPAGYGFIKYHLTIFDRWGQLIFESKDPNYQWDGTFNGLDAPVDVYVWRVVLEDLNFEQYVEMGHVTLIR